MTYKILISHTLLVFSNLLENLKKCSQNTSKQDWKVLQSHRMRNKWQILKIYDSLISAWQGYGSIYDVCLFVTEEKIYQRGTNYGALWHSSMSQQTLLHSITAVVGSRKLGQASILVFLTPRHLTCVNRCSDCIGYRIVIVCLIGTLSTILQYCTHNETHWPAAACQWHVVLWDVSHRQICHLSTPSYPTSPLGCDHTVSKISAVANSLCSEV
jgi:hypothetical protein